MKILLLGPERPEFEKFLCSEGDTVNRTEAKLTGDSPLLDGVDWIVSYGFRHIIKADVLNRFPQRAVNLHISYLPWNKGADPNLWSFLEDSPKGVTIHYIDRGVDTGDILAQQEVSMSGNDTLSTSYAKLGREIEALFCRVWPDIRAGRLTGKKQPEGGSVHRMKDKKEYEHLLTDDWDTPVRLLIGQALVNEHS